jgi:hypothetical protein
MDATLKLKAEQLASELATQAKTLDDVNGLLKTLMKSALERGRNGVGSFRLIFRNRIRFFPLNFPARCREVFASASYCSYAACAW